MGSSSAWWTRTPQEACVFQFQIRSTSKTPAFSTVLVYLCIILGTCTSVFRSVAKSWCLINVAILMHTKEQSQIYAQKKTYCPRATDDHLLSGCQNHPPPTKKKGESGTPQTHLLGSLGTPLCLLSFPRDVFHCGSHVRPHMEKSLSNWSSAWSRQFWL